MLTQVSNASFDAAVQENDVALIDFSAAWCGPCKALHPTLEAVAEEFGDKALIGKVDVDENPELAQRFGVNSIPAIFYFKGGELVKKQVGNQPKTAIQSFLNELVAGN